MESFASEYQALLKNDELPNRSRLLSLQHYLDEKGLRRVGGRLRKGPLPEEIKHPIILDPKHEITRLIVAQFHQRLH